jgi:2-dehydropantoate 2-reductase
MKILFYGAGVLGSLYAARLQEAGQEVSILARGQRLADVRKHGIVLEDGDTGQRTTTRVNVVEQLAPDDTYDLVVVLMRKNQVSAILPDLAANQHSPSILFMNNNVAGPDEMVEALGRERVLLGFPGAAGHREGHSITFKVASGRQQPTTFGELDGRTTPRLKQIVAAFKSAGFPVTISPNMDAWLKTHIAEVGPAANAIYLAGGDNYRLASTRDGLVLMVRAIREGYRVLRALGVPITPANHKIFDWIPEPILVALVRRLLNTKTAEIEMAGHANAARDEFKQLADDFRALARTTSVPTPAVDRLYTYLDPAVPPLSEGSAQIPPSWRSV